MKSDPLNWTLRKLTEAVARDLADNAPLVERFYGDVALFVVPVGEWAVGLRVEDDLETWSVTEVVAIPSGPVQSLPSLGHGDLMSYVDDAVRRGRLSRQAALDLQRKVKANADFIQERFEAWQDKGAAKTDVEYAALAAKYAEQVGAGNAKATATLAELCHVSAAVMAQRIKEARRRQLLTPGERGKASGALTPLGALLTDPEFPGFRQLRAAGMTAREIAQKYGISEPYAWYGLMEVTDFAHRVFSKEDEVVPPRILDGGSVWSSGYGTSQA